jgi:hypothetical protein
MYTDRHDLILLSTTSRKFNVWQPFRNSFVQVQGSKRIIG